MKQVTTLVTHLFRKLLFSLPGLLAMLGMAAVWWLFFNPTDSGTPEFALLVLINGIFGFAASFILTLLLSNRIYRGENAPLFVRLSKRVFFLVAALIAVLLFVGLLQVILAAVAFIQPTGTEWIAGRWWEMPAVWLSLNLFAIMLAFHATDLVHSGWSRVLIFGLLTLLLFSQSMDVRSARWFSGRFSDFATFLSQRDMIRVSGWMRETAAWFNEKSLDVMEQIGVVFWPFRAISESVQNGAFNEATMLAPLILLLYAGILFILAADFLNHKDLHLLD